MDELNRIRDRLSSNTYAAKEDEASNLYKTLLTIATSIKEVNDSIAFLDDNVNPTLSEASNLNVLAGSFNFTRLNLETDASLRLRLKQLLMPKVNGKMILNIIGMFTSNKPYMVETAPYTFDIHIVAGDIVSPGILFGIGPGDDSWGAAIGDDDADSAGATYYDPESGTIVSLDYLQALLNKIRPAGTVGTIVQD
jgi:hypothetical protein